MINLVTKSGTQEFHGGVYYYNRNEDFNANNFFNNRAQPFIPRQRYRYNTAGIDFGGPIYIPRHFNTNKQKLFFFFSQEDRSESPRPTATSNFTVPTALERAGKFFAVFIEQRRHSVCSEGPHHRRSHFRTTSYPPTGLTRTRQNC